MYMCFQRTRAILHVYRAEPFWEGRVWLCGNLRLLKRWGRLFLGRLLIRTRRGRKGGQHKEKSSNSEAQQTSFCKNHGLKLQLHEKACKVYHAQQTASASIHSFTAAPSVFVSHESRMTRLKQMHEAISDIWCSSVLNLVLVTLKLCTAFKHTCLFPLVQFVFC